MAIMHPSDINTRKHEKSEEKLFNACRDQLDDKYHVFFSVNWFSEENGERIDSECDFLIFNPNYGFLCVECKGGSRIYVDGNETWYLEDKKYGTRKLKRSPYLQAEESKRFFKKYYEDETGGPYHGIYGSAVVFPNYCITSPITKSSPLELTIDMEGMRNLGKRIVEIFRYFKENWKGTSEFMSPDNQRKFISLVNKRIALSVAAGALIEDKERELAEINRTQDVVIDMLTNYPRAFIIGGAGTGKTWIGIKKIKRAVLRERKALFLCCNGTLAAFVREQVDSPEADVFSFEDLTRRLLGEAASQAPVKDGCAEYAELLLKAEGLPQYDLIVVDEAQDFTEDWAICVNLMLRHNGSLYVFYDENQNVYQRSFGDKFCIDEPPFVLRYNIRNTSNIYQYTRDRTDYGKDTLVNQIEGVEPDVRRFHGTMGASAALSFIDAQINKLVHKEGVAPDRITILSNREPERSVLSGTDKVGGCPLVSLGAGDGNSVTFSTVSEFKGLESDIVFFINHTYKNEPYTEDVRSVQYTAFTRARFYLYVIDYEIEP